MNKDNIKLIRGIYTVDYNSTVSHFLCLYSYIQYETNWDFRCVCKNRYEYLQSYPL